MRFEFQNVVEKYHAYFTFGGIYVGMLVLMILMKFESIILLIVTGLGSLLIILGCIYIIWIFMPWNKPIIYEIVDNELTIAYKLDDPKKADLGSVWKIYFMNQKYRKKLRIHFIIDGNKMYHEMSVFRNKSWPREQWQQLFEELKKRCLNAEIIEK